MNYMADATLPNKITRLYLVALSAVALLLMGGQLVVQRSLQSQLTDSRIINIAGRQRMLSQKICKTIVLLYYQNNQQKTPDYLADLEEALTLWEKSHAGLKNGHLASLKTPVNNSLAIQAKFSRLEPLYQTILRNAHVIRNYFHAPATPEHPRILSNINLILKNEPAYLEAMDQIVFQYDQEASQRVNKSQQTEKLLLLGTLGVLLLEGLFVFRPAVKQIKYTIAQLIAAKQQTQLINEELMEANHSLATTKEALLEATNLKFRQELHEQKLRSTYLIEGQEEERKRVAREIHDGLGQMLTALKYGIEKISDSIQDTETARHNFSEIRQLISQTISETRTISFNLMPAVLSDFGLASALKLLTAQVTSGSGINVSFTTNWNGKRLAKNIEIGLYRVSQEALHNAIKYAQADDITVNLMIKRKHIQLTVSDNGGGFTTDKLNIPSPETGLAHGISNMKERVFLMNGNIKIISTPETGTHIQIKVPFLSIAHV